MFHDFTFRNLRGDIAVSSKKSKDGVAVTRGVVAFVALDSKDKISYSFKMTVEAVAEWANALGAVPVGNTIICSGVPRHVNWMDSGQPKSALVFRLFDIIDIGPSKILDFGKDGSFRHKSESKVLESQQEVVKQPQQSEEPAKPLMVRRSAAEVHQELGCTDPQLLHNPGLDDVPL